MAFVYRSEKLASYVNQQNSIGPGYYNPGSKANQDPPLQPLKVVPFSSSVERNNYNSHEVPGIILLMIDRAWYIQHTVTHGWIKSYI